MLERGGLDAATRDRAPVELDWRRAYERMLRNRNASLMDQAAQLGETTRLHAIATWWKEKFPLKTKLAIGAGLLTAGVLGNAAIAGMVGVGALAWRLIGSAFTGAVAGAAAHTYLSKRNYNRVSLLSGTAGALTGLFSFFGGKLLADYFTVAATDVPNKHRLVAIIEPNGGRSFQGFLNTQLFGNGGTLADAQMSPANKGRLVAAIEHTFRHNPDHSRALFAMSDQHPALREYETMLRTAHQTQGFQLNFSHSIPVFPRVMGSEAFLRDLELTIRGNFPSLAGELKKADFNLDSVLGGLHDAYAAKR